MTFYGYAAIEAVIAGHEEVAQAGDGRRHLGSGQLLAARQVEDDEEQSAIGPILGASAVVDVEMALIHGDDESGRALQIFRPHPLERGVAERGLALRFQPATIPLTASWTTIMPDSKGSAAGMKKLPPGFWVGTAR